MNILYILASLAFFIWIVRNTLFWVYLWQLKEYRLDRLLVHFRETEKGKDILRSPIAWIKWVLIISYVVPTFYEGLLLPFQFLVTIIFLFEAIKTIRELITHKLRRPVFTLRAILVIVLTLFVMGMLYLLPLVEQYVWLLLLDKILPLIISLFVFFMAIPSDFVKDIFIDKAAKKMRLHPDVLVIGVSGSYGKSSTKEYIAQILSHKFNVIKTDGSHNTPMGISRTIMAKLTGKTQVFVVELGSYKKGEVAELCQIVHPKISVTTSISDQHLSLYGSFENIIETEMELINAIPKNGFSLLNGNNPNTNKIYKELKKKKVLYEVSNDNKNSTDESIQARNLQVKKTSVCFEVSLNGSLLSFEAPLIGGHNVENILPAIYLANHLKMKSSEIQKAVLHLTPLSKTMVYHKTIQGYVVIDDTFNASPESVKAALEYMKVYSKKKYLVFEPMIELGENTDIDHYNLGKQISVLCSHIFLTNKNYYSSIQRGIQDGGGTCKITVGNSSEIASILKPMVKSGDIIVLEGRESAMVLPKLL